jgi:hypothetical protein
MGFWNDESRWVNDDGFRCYFVSSDNKGPSRLDTYRRLLSATEDTKVEAPAWRRYPAAIVSMLQGVGL